MTNEKPQKGSTGATPQRDGEPPELWMTTFLEALASTGRVAEACRVIGRDRAQAYRHRHQYPAFAEAWERVENDRDRHIADALAERLIHGTPEEVWFNGQMVGVKMVHDNRTALQFLKSRAPSEWSERRIDQGSGTEGPTIRIEFAKQPETEPDTTKDAD